MPWTFAHPAAVLPFRKFAPARLSFAALVAGSVAPDLGYYFGRFDLATQAHSLAGLFLVCLPMGFALLALLRALRQPVCYLLPQPHRPALLSLPQIPLFESAAAVWKVALSLLLGAFTHIAWDSFTHSTGWAVAHLPIFYTPVTILPGHGAPLFNVLQHASTVLGVAVLWAAYAKWLRKAVAETSGQDQAAERWRYLLLAGIALASLLAAAPLAYTASLSPSGGILIHPFIFRFVVYATTASALMLAAAALLVACCCANK